MTWNLPLPQEDGPQTIGVSKLLPAGVTLVAPVPPATAPTAFSAQVSAVPPISRSLADNCPSCPSGTAPKPAFNAPIASTSVTLPTGLSTATLAAGSKIVLSISNGFSFDPIRPPGGATGTIALAVLNGTTTIGNLDLDGATQAIPAGQVTNVTLTLNAGTTINTSLPLTVTQTMVSPAGDISQPVAMSPTQTFSVSATPTINVSSATVSIGAQSIDSPGSDMDLSGIDTTVANRIPDSTSTQGTLFLEVTTPFTISATATVTFTGTREVEASNGSISTVAIVPVVKNITLPAATPSQNTFTIPVNLSGKELRRMLGSSLVATFTGNTSPGTTVVTPTSEITISGRMQIHLYVREIQ